MDYGERIAEPDRSSMSSLMSGSLTSSSGDLGTKQFRSRRIISGAAFLLLAAGAFFIGLTLTAKNGYRTERDLREASSSNDVDFRGDDLNDLGENPLPVKLNPSSSDSVSYSRPTRHIENRPASRNRVPTTARPSSVSGTNFSVSGTIGSGGQNQTTPRARNSTNPISLLNEKEHRYHPRYEFEHCTLHRKKITVQSFWSTVYIQRTNQTFGPAYGRNKKEAKRRVAEIALTQLYNMTYPTTPDPLIPRHQVACSESSQQESAI